MIIFLVLIPILTIISALSIYKHNGKREFLKFDVVQFVYSFVMAPLFFIWMKSFILTIMRSELGSNLSFTQIILIDSVFSVLFLYVYAFVVIHSLTKSFKMKKLTDPLYDMFMHSEYFHLWLSHVVMFAGGMLIFTLFSLLNLAFPLPTVLGNSFMLGVLILGTIGGLLTYIGALLSNPLQLNFMRLMKLLFGAGFFLHIMTYFIFEPSFKSDRWFYWCCFTVFATLTVCSLLWHRSEKTSKYINRLKDYQWGHNVEL